jgi:hypothetical protein
MTLLILNTIHDLNRYLSASRAMSRRALRELDQMIDELKDPKNTAEEIDFGLEFLRREAKLIEGYARTPTLTDFSRDASLAGIAHWGTTFCVSTLFSEIILGNIRAIEERFVKAHRMLAILLMKELDDPSPGLDTDLVDTALRFMKIELRQDLGALSATDRTKLLRSMVTPVVTAMMSVFMSFGLVRYVDEGGYALTDVGTHVLYHLFDAQTFIDEIVATHADFQTRFPRSQVG